MCNLKSMGTSGSQFWSIVWRKIFWIVNPSRAGEGGGRVAGCDVFRYTWKIKPCSLPYTGTLVGKLKWEIFHDTKWGGEGGSLA